MLRRTTFSHSVATNRSRFFPRMPSSSLSSSSSSSSPVSTTSTSAGNGGGISFESQEQQCGMLFTLAAIKHISPSISSSFSKNNNNSTMKALKPQIPIRLGAAIKCNSADWQVNEIPSTSSTNNNQEQEQEETFFPGEIVTKNNKKDSSESSSSSSLFSELEQLENDIPLVVTKMPKGRWRKISGKVTKKVEVDSTTPFSDPNKGYRDLSVSLGTYVYKKGKIPVDRETLEFSCYRENTPWSAVERRISRKLNLSPNYDKNRNNQNNNNQNNNRIRVSSPKESFGCVTQLGQVDNVSAEMLPHASRHYNIHPIILNPLRFVPKKKQQQKQENYGTTTSTTTELKNSGNHWRVMLRCVDSGVDEGSASQIEEIQKHLTRLSETGAVNYFPLRSFGGCVVSSSSSSAENNNNSKSLTMTAPIASEIAAAAGNSGSGNNYFDACRLWLYQEAQRDYFFHSHYSKYISADQSAIPGILDIAIHEMKDVKQQLFQQQNNNNSSTSSSSSSTKQQDQIIAALEFLRKQHNFNKNYSNNTSNNSSGNFNLSEEVCKELWNEILFPSSSVSNNNNILRNPLMNQSAIKSAPFLFLWNLAASQRLYQFGCGKEGGRAEGGGVPLKDFIFDKKINLVRLVQPGEENFFRIDDVVVPFPEVKISSSSACDDNNNKSWYDDFYTAAMKKFNYNQNDISRFLLSSQNICNNNDTTTKTTRRFRKLILKPTKPMQFFVQPDPNSLSILKTDLFLRQERKLPLEASLEERFRTPTLYNVSDAFRQKMQSVIHDPPSSSSSSSYYSSSSSIHQTQRGAGRCSVAIECDLPAGTHISSLLREVFLMRHLHSNDMFDIVNCE